MVPGGATVPITDLQPSIIFYPGSLDAQYHSNEPSPQEVFPVFSSGELRAVWSIDDLRIFNSQATPLKILKVILKPPTDSGQAFPPEFVGLASAALLTGDWSEEFRNS